MTKIHGVWAENIGSTQMGKAVAILHDKKRGFKVLSLSSQGVYFLVSPTEIQVNVQQQDTPPEQTSKVANEINGDENDETGKSE